MKYMSVSGSKLDPGQLLPPGPSGEVTLTTFLFVPHGVNIGLPATSGSPGAALSPSWIAASAFLIGNCGLKGGSVGVGCVGEVSWNADWGTFFSGIGKIGLPVLRSRM